MPRAKRMKKQGSEGGSQGTGNTEVGEYWEMQGATNLEFTLLESGVRCAFSASKILLVSMLNRPFWVLGSSPSYQLAPRDDERRRGFPGVPGCRGSCVH